MNQYREEVEVLKIDRENLSASLQEKGLALESTQKSCKEVQDRLQEVEADREGIRAAKSIEDQASGKEAEELKMQAARELSLARWAAPMQNAFPLQAFLCNLLTFPQVC